MNWSCYETSYVTVCQFQNVGLGLSLASIIARVAGGLNSRNIPGILWHVRLQHKLQFLRPKKKEIVIWWTMETVYLLTDSLDVYL